MKRARRSKSSWRWRAAAIGVAAVAVQEVAARWYYRRTPAPEQPLCDDERTAWTAAWHEIAAPLEWLASMARRNAEVPRGDGAPVLLVSGFLTKGFYLAPLRRWLREIGYDARVVDLGWNADCFHALTDRLIAEVEVTRRRSGRRAHLIGHSLGGVLARAATVRAPHAVASTAVVGSPVRGLRLHPALRAAAAAVRLGIRRTRGASVPSTCATFACPCETVRAIATPLPVDTPLVTIATRNDGLTDWRYTVDTTTTPATLTHSSHVGLAFDPVVYEALAAHLLRASDRRVRSVGRSVSARPARASGTGPSPRPRR